MVSAFFWSSRLLSDAARTGAAAVRRRLPLITRGATWWSEILLLAALYGVYELSRGLGGADIGTALSNGRSILHLEQVWHVDPERILNAGLAHATWIAVGASYFYSVMHYVVTPGVLIWMYRRHRDNYGRARTALVISTVVGLIGYLLLPTAPPRMVASSGLQDTLAHTSRWGWWGGEGSVPRGLGALTNEFAAMPSLHVGWSIWCGVLIALYARRRWVKALGVSYPLATTLVVMATGNHYLLDAVAGAVVMALGAALAAALPRRQFTVAAIGADHESLDEVVAGRSTTGVRYANEPRSARTRPLRGGSCTTVRDREPSRPWD